MFVVSFDMLLNGFLIAETGGWYSPFTLYAFTTLFWLATYLPRVKVIFTALAFFMISSAFPKILTVDLMLPHSYIIGTKLLLDLTTWTCMIFTSLFFVRYLRKLYANFVQLYLFQKRLPDSKHVFDICSLTETVLKRVFAAKQVFLCFFHEWEKDPNWRRHYFFHSLLDQGEQHYKKPAEITLTDYMGKKVPFILFPLDTGWRCEGVILIQLKEGCQLSRFNYLYLRLVAVSICTQRKQIKLKRDMEKAMHQEMRKMLAKDMHDGLAQQLFFLSAQLFKVKHSIGPLLTEQTAATIVQMEQQIKSCHLEVRDFITYLHDQNRSSDIFDAIEQLVTRITSGVEIKVAFSTKGRITEESLQIMDTMYRLVEEATYNVIKHAKASHLDISIEVSAVQWTVKMKDDGVGFIFDNHKEKSYGVNGMKERVYQVGGSMKIRSRPNNGTEIIAIIPRKAVEMYV